MSTANKKNFENMNTASIEEEIKRNINIRNDLSSDIKILNLEIKTAERRIQSAEEGIKNQNFTEEKKNELRTKLSINTKQKATSEKFLGEKKIELGNLNAKIEKLKEIFKERKRQEEIEKNRVETNLNEDEQLQMNTIIQETKGFLKKVTTLLDEAKPLNDARRNSLQTVKGGYRHSL